MDVKKHVYITVNGREVEYQAISLDALQLSKRGLERAYRERGEPIDPPTYEFETGSGAKIKEPHDATTPKTPEEQTAWDAYIDATNRLDAENAKVNMRFILDDGLPQIKLPDDTNWQEKYKARYIDIPTDPIELRDFYITNEILQTRPDIDQFYVTVMVLSQYGKVDPDVLEARLELFRGFVGWSAAQRIKRSEKQVEPQLETNGA